MSEKAIVDGIAGVVRTYELMDRVRARQDLVIRDDQFDLEALRDAVAYARRRGIRLSLLDTGRFGLADIEGLAVGGARVLTSDEARPRSGEWEILLEACRRGGTRLSAFWNGPLPAAGEGPGFSARTLEDLLGGGLDLHLSDRVHGRDAGALAELASVARRGRGYFVLYRIGPPLAALAEAAGRRAWVHFGDRDAADEGWAAPALEIARAASSSGARAVVHVERGLPLDLLEELWDAGAALVFLTPPSDEGSLLRPVERKAARRKLPARAFHLSTAFLP